MTNGEFAIVRNGDRLFIRYIVKIEQAKTGTRGAAGELAARSQDPATERPLHFVFSQRMRQLSPLTHRSSIRFCTQSSQRRVKRTEGGILGNVSIGIDRRSIRSDPPRLLLTSRGTCSTSTDLLQLPRILLRPVTIPRSSRGDMPRQFSPREQISDEETHPRDVCVCVC